MRIATSLISFLLFFVGCTSQAGSLDLQNKKVLILGDSITAAGAYVSYIEYYLQKNNLSAKYDIISIGLSSETASGLSEKDHPFPRPCLHTRLKSALELIKPTIVVACYGMNDGVYHPQSPENMKAYKDGVMKLVDLSKKMGAQQIVLNTPPPFDPQPVQKKLYKEGQKNFSYKHPWYKYNEVLEDYAAWIMSLKVDGVTSVDFNTPLTNYLKEKRKDDPNFRFSGDGIHPSPLGHLLMAQTFLKGIGAKIDFATLDEEFKLVNSDPLFKLVSQRRKLRSGGWLKYVGYKRGKTVKSNSVKETEEKSAALQVKIDELKKK